MDFPDTRWSLLAEASLHGDTVARESLEAFCADYRSPVLRMIRARGVPEDRVEDMAQEFFLELMENSTLKRADRDRGRFRTFLSGALTRFLSVQTARRAARKRGGDAAHLSIDAVPEMAETAATHEVSPLELDRVWVLHLVQRALKKVQQQWTGGDRETRFTVLRAFLPGAVEEISQADAAERLGLSDGALRVELHRLREAFRTAVRHEVAVTVSAPGDLEDEMRHLLRILQTPPRESL